MITAKTYCAAYTQDLHQVVKYLREKHVPTQPLIGVGYSLGSNILVKYLGEEQAAVGLTAAVSVGNPFDLMETSRHLTRSTLHKWVYNKTMLRGLHRLAKKVCAQWLSLTQTRSFEKRSLIVILESI